MSVSYRLKKKELVLLLDLFGDAGSLEDRGSGGDTCR